MDILLDCDGVLADFVTAAIKTCGRKEEHDDIRGWGFFEDWGLTEDEFWEKCKGREFWMSLKPYPWAKRLLKGLKREGDVTIMTSPSQDYECAGAKIEWLEKNLGVNYKDVSITHKKKIAANPSSLIIDDKPSHIDDFRSRGGRGILFSQPWNSERLDAVDVSDLLNYLTIVKGLWCLTR